jgi:hypothetical protein
MLGSNKISGRFFRRIGINIIFIAMALPACIVLPGCEVYDLFEKAVSSYWGQESVDVFVYPPVPKSFAETGATNPFFDDEAFGKDVENVLLNAILDFSDNSDRKVKCWYSTLKPQEFAEFYKLLSDSPRDIEDILRDDINNNRKKETKLKNISMIMIGIYDDSNSKATSYKTALYLYDYNKNFMVKKFGDVARQPGRAQNGDLESLVKAVLKEVFN